MATGVSGPSKNNLSTKGKKQELQACLEDALLSQSNAPANSIRNGGNSVNSTFVGGKIMCKCGASENDGKPMLLCNKCGC